MIVHYFSPVLYQTWNTPTNIHVSPILNFIKFVCISVGYRVVFCFNFNVGQQILLQLVQFNSPYNFFLCTAILDDLN